MGFRGASRVEILEVRGAERLAREDLLAIEEPLEIRILDRSISITMRTPGHDEELAAGFLFGEGILREPGDVLQIRACTTAENVVRVELEAGVTVDLKRLDRHFYTSSSCGVCGKASLDSLATLVTTSIPKEPFTVEAKFIHGLPQSLREAQPIFDQTGGLHAAALFNADGEILSLREDVGRHNAVDKLIGSRFLEGGIPLSPCGLLVSGRASFELVQKAVMAGVPFMAAVGAPSSLAVSLAKKFDVTLLGFVRNERFNIYHGGWRVR